MAGGKKVTWKQGEVTRLRKYDERSASEDVILVTVMFPKYAGYRQEWTRKSKDDDKFNKAWDELEVGKKVRVYFSDGVFSHITVLEK